MPNYRHGVPQNKPYDQNNSMDLGDFRDTAYRGLASALGSPVDILSSAMRPFGYGIPEQDTVMSSEWLGRQFEDMGLVSQARNPVSEFIGAMMIPDPTDIATMSKFLGATLVPGMAKHLDESVKVKNFDEFANKEAIRKQLQKDGTKINDDDTVTLYHATSKDRLENIKKEGLVRGGATATGGMTGIDLKPSAFFGTDKKWVTDTWGDGGKYDILEVKVPLEYIRKPAGNKLEVYFEGGLQKNGDIWTPVDEVRDTFYNNIPKRIHGKEIQSKWDEFSSGK